MADVRSPSSESTTVLGADCSLKGELSFVTAMRIEGKFEGKIQSGGKLALGRTAQIVADVSVGQLALEGAFKGSVQASERVELGSNASLTANVTAPRLVMAEGAALIGLCQIGGTEASRALEQAPKVAAPLAPRK
jgi:cytoskeletal protein CcmA (bactofilin family)